MKLLIIILGVLLGLIVLPVLLLGGLALIFSGTKNNIHRRLAKLRGPNGVLDGRKNVRVVLPEDSHARRQ